MRSHWPLRMMDWAVPLGFGIFLCATVPLRSALQLGGDEGYELMKGLLVSLGHPLYSEIWNDHPPLHTQVVGWLFGLVGPSALAARLVTVGLAMVMVGALYRLASEYGGRGAGLAAVALLVSSAHFLQLSVSAMLEFPAMALAMAGVWAWFAYFGGRGKHWLVWSGVLFACGLQVKFTAALFLPALAVDYLGRRIRRFDERNDLSHFWSKGLEPVVWGAASGLVFGVVIAAFYNREALMVFWASHFSRETYEAVAPVFQPGSLLKDYALSLSAALGLALAVWRRRTDLVFPVALLATVLAVHWWHRPHWYYYALHFAIPMAWLGGAGIAGWCAAIWRQDFRKPAAKWRAGFGWLGWSLVVSLSATLAGERFWNQWVRVSSAQPAAEDARVRALQGHAAETRWVYTDRTIYAFWAGLPVPPELAVIPSKRWWSGQISEAEIVDWLEIYRPEQVLLFSSRSRTPHLFEYLRDHYGHEPAEGVDGLYLRMEAAGRLSALVIGRQVHSALTVRASCFSLERVLKIRSAAVSSSTSRSGFECSSDSESFTCCGWSSTQPRSVFRTRS